MRMIASIAALVTCSLASLHSADLDFADLRLSGGAISTEFRGSSTTTVSTSGSSVTTTTNSSDTGRNADDNWRGQLQFVDGHLGLGGGLIYGAGFAVNNAT